MSVQGSGEACDTGGGDRAYRLDGPLAARHHARILGSGREMLVFSHGLGTDQTAWEAVLPALLPGRSALLFDLPGAGPLLPDGFDPENYRSIAAFADDLLALLDEIGVVRCTFIGHSVSGMIGVLAAIEDPGRFDRLALLNASPRYLDDGAYAGGFGRADLDELLGAMAANYQAWVAGFASQAVAADVPEAVKEFSAGLLAMRPDITVRIARMIFESDLRHILAELRVPVILIHSRDDVAVPPAVADYLHRHLKGSRLVWIDATGHLPHLSHPDKVAKALEAQLG